ncbi:SEC14-like protein 1 isoform X2 [Watersipora subatra]|uniref:SEC14-like protein 1 isoform X2 n=1 Tax=Watersipora subatra TaxID=2589382 RepID=UPI00355BB74D
MVQKYQSPTRIYKYPFELVITAYERRFPTCKLLPVFLGSDIISEYKSEDGAIHVVERRCRLNVDAPYILKKLAGVDHVVFVQKNSLDRRNRTLKIEAHNESFHSRITINEHCMYTVHTDNPEWTCFEQDATLEIHSFFGFESVVEKIAAKQYGANIKKGKEVMHAFVNELKEEGVTYVAPWRPTPSAAAPETPSIVDQDAEEPVAFELEGATGDDLATTSSDFGSMCMEEAASLERARSNPRLEAEYIERHLGHLSPLQESRLIQLRKWLTETHKGKIPKDAHILRFLKARDFHVEKSREMLVHSLAWRKLHGVDSLLDNFVSADVVRKYFHGAWHHHDLEGRPVYILCLGQMDVKGLIKSVGVEGIIKQIIAIEEEGIKKCEKATETTGHAVGSCTLIVDLEGLSMRHLWRPGVKTFGRILSLLEANYPETMGRLTLVRAPRVFPILWTVVSPFIDENTRKKFVVYSGHNFTGLSAYIDQKYIPDFLGGQCKSAITTLSNKTVPRTFYQYTTEEIELEQEKSSDNPSLLGRSAYQTAYVAKDFPQEVLVQVPQKNSVITWDFDVLKGDITFTIYRSREHLSAPRHEHHVPGAAGGIGSQQYIGKRMSVGVDLVTCCQPCICRDGDSIQGSHVATSPGSYVLQWTYFDSSHSFDPLSLNKSHVIYFVELFPSERVRGSMTSLQSSSSLSTLRTSRGPSHINV